MPKWLLILTFLPKILLSAFQELLKNFIGVQFAVTITFENAYGKMYSRTDTVGLFSC